MDKDKAKTKKTQKTAENRAKTPDAAAVDYAITTAKLSDLIPDDKNFNKGTEFGQHLIEKSLRENGAGRSILIDKNNRIIAGNKTTENAAAIDLNDVIIVETDGTKLVAVKRTDIDIDTEQGRQMALADNATSAANLSWDEDQLRAMQKEMDGFDPEEWGVKMLKKSMEAAEAMIGKASSTDATKAYSDDTDYNLENLIRNDVDEEILQKIEDGIERGEIRKEIARILDIRAKQCTIFNFDEIIKFYRSNDATALERELLRRLYLVFVAPKELFEQHILRLNDVANRIFDDELMSKGENDNEDEQTY
jgi:hypothetical protein